MDNELEELTFLCNAAAVVHVTMKKRKIRKRRLWSEQWLLKRYEGQGILSLLENELNVDNPMLYRSFLRFCKPHFDELINGIKQDIYKRDTNMREAISPSHRLAITLRYLAMGESYRSLMLATRIHESTISLIVPQVCKAIIKNVKDIYIKMPTTSEEWKRISSDFYKMWNFPLCLGALDGKHIEFMAPRSEGSFYYNYKGKNSIVLLALVDATYRFLYVDIGVNGRVSDGGVYRESSLKKGIDSGIIQFPEDECLPNHHVPVPYVFVADGAFPMSHRILKPYGARELTNEKRICNYRISRARRVVENAFGILSNRFRVLLRSIPLNAHKVEDITFACCILHNFLVTKNNDYVAIHNIESLTHLNRQGGNRSTNVSLQTRNVFCEYFNTVGAVPWQNRVLNVND